MVGLLGKTTNLSRDVVGQQAQSEREAIWGEIEGEIRSFDAKAQTATIQPLYKPRHNGKVIDMPELLEVPVRFTRGGNGAITFPVKAGDRVTLRPKMRSSEKYHDENNGEASDARSFNLSDMEAYLDGGESLTDPIKNFDAANLTDPIPNFDGANAHFRFDSDGKYGVRGSKDGKIKIEGNQGNIYDLLARVTELLEETNSWLKQEPELIYKPQYAAIEAETSDIAGKLRAMQL